MGLHRYHVRQLVSIRSMYRWPGLAVEHSRPDIVGAGSEPTGRCDYSLFTARCSDITTYQGVLVSGNAPGSFPVE